MESIENFFLSIGVGMGDYGDIQRFLLTAGITTAILFIWKPKVFFLEDGTPKQWFLLSNNKEHNEYLTRVPWWFVSLAVGTIFGIVV